LKPLLKYVYALHIAAFLGYNQEFSCFHGDALYFTSGSFSDAAWLESPTGRGLKLEAIICVEELNEKDDNENYFLSKNEYTVGPFFSNLYNSVASLHSEDVRCVFPRFKEALSKYLLLGVLRL
jgi:hypothetical protein